MRLVDLQRSLEPLIVDRQLVILDEKNRRFEIESVEDTAERVVIKLRSDDEN